MGHVKQMDGVGGQRDRQGRDEGGIGVEELKITWLQSLSLSTERRTATACLLHSIIFFMPVFFHSHFLSIYMIN